MIPALKERAKACTAARNVPAETVAEMQAAGFFKVLQPKRWGGYEMNPNVYFDILRTLGRGLHVVGLDLWRDRMPSL